MSEDLKVTGLRGYHLVQTRISGEDMAWLCRAAGDKGVSIAGALRAMIAEARTNERTSLDAASVESRLTERMRTLEDRVADLERTRR